MAGIDALALTLPPAVTSAGKAPLPAPAAKAAKEFEAMFLSEMLAPMFQGVSRSSLFGGPGQEIWTSMLTQEYARTLAQGGGIGIGDAMMRQLMQQQEVK